MQRYWEIDFLKGIAVIAMIAFHFMFDLYYFRSLPIDIFSGPVFWTGRFAGTAFLFLVGINQTISFYKVKQQNKPAAKKFFFRAAKIFFFGLLITLITFVVVPQGTIWFGILHLIGASVILSLPFIEKKWLSLAVGIVCLAVGFFLQQFAFPFPWLLWLGFAPENFYTFDYYPIFPWFGIVLFGIFFGNLLYPKAVQKIKLPDYSNLLLIKQLCFLGKNSLLIYLLHQPVLIAIVLLLT